MPESTYVVQALPHADRAAGRELFTLQDAADYIASLPKTESDASRLATRKGSAARRGSARRQPVVGMGRDAKSIEPRQTAITEVAATYREISGAP